MKWQLMKPGEPFWAAFTAFCSTEAVGFTLDKLDVLTVERVWLATVGALFVAGSVYGREKLAEAKQRREKEERRDR